MMDTPVAPVTPVAPPQPLYPNPNMGQPQQPPRHPPADEWMEGERLARYEEEQRRLVAAQQYWTWLRGAVASRLELASLHQADLTWRHRNGKRGLRLAPVSVALVYADPTGRPNEPVAVKLAAKMFEVTDSGPDPMDVLYDLTVLAGGGDDPRLVMSENPDDMGPNAVYQGVAVLLLDTPTASWGDVQKRREVQSGYTIPGRILAVLADETCMVIDRREHRAPDHIQVFSTRALSLTWGGAGRRWYLTPDLFALDNPAPRDLGNRLWKLHEVINGRGRHAY